MSKKLVFVNINYEGNVGDYWSSPLHYYNFSNYEYEKIHFMDIHRGLSNVEGHLKYLIKDCIVILGGGGLITTHSNYMTQVTKYLIENNKVILWGIGSNTNLIPAFDIIYHPNVLLAGIRDIVHLETFDYLPCVSCKHPLFDKTYEEKDKIGILEHSDYGVQIPNLPRIQNNTKIEDYIDFIGTKFSIISSTYHGVYWSQLLNKNVVFYNDVGVNSKMINMKHRVNYCNKDNYITKLDISSKSQNLLYESRMLNDLFYKKVISILEKYLI